MAKNLLTPTLRSFSVLASSTVTSVDAGVTSSSRSSLQRTLSLSSVSPLLSFNNNKRLFSSDDKGSHDDFAPQKKKIVDDDDDEALALIKEHVTSNHVMLYMKGK